MIHVERSGFILHLQSFPVNEKARLINDIRMQIVKKSFLTNILNAIFFLILNNSQKPDSHYATSRAEFFFFLFLQFNKPLFEFH